MKKRLLIGVIFLVICISLIIYNELDSKRQYKTNIHDVTNSASKEENISVYLEATFIAGSVKSNKDTFYVIFGDGVQYLVKIDDKKAIEINNYLLDNPTKSYKIVGVTKLIPSEIEENGIKFVNNYLNSLHDHEHNITKDDFYHYFGYVYLDTYVDNNVLLIIIISITGVIGVILLFNEILKKVNNI